MTMRHKRSNQNHDSLFDEYIVEISSGNWSTDQPAHLAIACPPYSALHLDSSYSTSLIPVEHEVKIEETILLCVSLNSNDSFTSQLAFSLHEWEKIPNKFFIPIKKIRFICNEFINACLRFIYLSTKSVSPKFSIMSLNVDWRSSRTSLSTSKFACILSEGPQKNIDNSNMSICCD